MENLLPIKLAPLILLIVGCSTSIEVTKTQNFDSNASITIVSQGNDPMGVQSKLEHQLLSKGFIVISESTALEKLRYHEETDNTETRSTTSGEITAVLEISSLYSLTYQYTTRMDVPAGIVFSNFSASVVRMIDGQLVASANFSQGQLTGKRIDKVLEEFIDQLNE